ncbi:unnamed protein product [Cyprideis torosa]|uniref:Uncharacterized protein n=1 Tax=Cyprideis torosa TaxID=163714 RepID=A0A7R8W0Q8_9CRUS|nr:unnamed protein product [Cyprideis torosa]CAG0880016.1 unnamed protein product [Cyprideis torosa]
MEVIRVSEFGDSNAMKVQNLPVPIPQETQVLIRLRATGVNPADSNIQNGTYGKRPKLPPGKDGAGIVERVGELVKKLKVGDRVFYCQRNGDGDGKGAYAHYVCCDQDEVFPLGERLSFTQGAALGVPYMTAYRALVIKGEAAAGQTVLVHGASGSVGIASVQLGRFLGLKVLGTAGTPEGIQAVKEQGADFVFDHSKPGYMEEIKNTAGEKGIDLIVEMLSNANLGENLGLLASRAKVLVCKM